MVRMRVWVGLVVVAALVVGGCDPGVVTGPSDRDWHGPDLFGGAAIVSRDPGGGACTNSGPATLRIDASGAAVLTVRTTGDIVRDNAGACAVMGEETIGFDFQGTATVGGATAIQFATCGSTKDKQASGTAEVRPGGAAAKGMTQIRVSCSIDGQVMHSVTASLDRLDPSK
jgi:hypothetical protein